MKYSIIFLVHEKDEYFPDLVNLICQLFEKRNKAFEILIVANATENFLKDHLVSGINYPKGIRIISFQRAVSQSLCLKAALSECSGEYVLTLGSSQELFPPDYEKIIESMTDGVDLVVPYRKGRRDSILSRVHSRLLNRAIKRVTGVKINDIGCSVRFFRKEVLDALNIYGNMYRYLPVFAVQKGYKVKEVECGYYQRAKKIKFYGPGLYLRRLLEIVNLFFSTKFSKKPLRFFNLAGLSFMLLGIIFLTFLSVQKIVYGITFGDRNLLLIAMIFLVAGAQIASFGLLGEIVAFIYGRSQKEYSIEKII